jgi:multidrug efflux pump subunit AcrA (membrane-fusion protein)
MMLFSKTQRAVVSGVMCLFLSNVPGVALADSGMIATQTVVQEMSRAETLNEMNAYLQREDIQKELLKAGVEPKEVSERLASLSEQEMKQLSGQLSQARAGGDILITILIIVLIIFLIKRI